METETKMGTHKSHFAPVALSLSRWKPRPEKWAPPAVSIYHEWRSGVRNNAAVKIEGLDMPDPSGGTAAGPLVSGLAITG